MERRDLLAASVLHNAENPADVNNDNNVSALDALIVVNTLTRAQRGSAAAGEAGSAQHGASGHYPDVSGDGSVTASDALRVINAMVAEGEQGDNINLNAPSVIQIDPGNARPVSGLFSIADERNDASTMYNVFFSADNNNPPFPSIGTITVGDSTGVSFFVGDGTDDPQVGFTGSLSAVNNAIDSILLTINSFPFGLNQLLFSVTDNSSPPRDEFTNTLLLETTGSTSLTANDDTLSVDEDQTLIFDASTLFGNDDNPNPNIPFTLTGIQGFDPNSPSLFATDRHGNLGFNQQTNQLTYTPPPNLNGMDSFNYTIGQTVNGVLAESHGNVQITVNPINDAPVVTVSGDREVDEDNTLSLPGFMVDDVDSDDITVDLSVNSGVLSVGGQTGSTISVSGPSISGLSYTPSLNFNGTDTITVNASDGNDDTTDTVNITVQPVNDGPLLVVPGKQSFFTDFDNRLSVTPTVSDVDGEPLIELNLTLTEGTATAPSSLGQVNVLGSGTNSLTYSGFNDDVFGAIDDTTFSFDNAGNETLTVTVNDSNQTNPLTATETIDITVTDETFLQKPAEANVGIGGSVTFRDISVKPIPGMTGPIRLTISAFNQTLQTFFGDSILGSTEDITILDSRPENLRIEGTIDAINNALNGLTFSIRGAALDAPQGNRLNFVISSIDDVSFIRFCSILINPVGSTTTVAANNDFASTDEGSSTFVDVLVNDFKRVPSLAAMVTEVEGQDVTGGQTVTLSSGGQVSSDGTGVTYSPPGVDFFGTDTFSYTITDGATQQAFSSAIVTIDLDPVNDAPIAIDEEVIDILEDSGPQTIDVLANDDVGGGLFPDPDDTLTITTVDDPSGGTAKIDHRGTGNPSDDVITFTPDPGFVGTTTFTYTIEDSGDLTDSATISINVIDQFQGAQDDSISGISEDQGETTLLLVDNDDVAGNATITAIQGTPVSLGSTVTTDQGGEAQLGASGVNYTPPSDFNGTDTFTYTITDSAGPINTDTATVTIDLAKVNDMPVAEPDTATTTVDTPVTISPGQAFSNDMPGPPNESDETLEFVSVFDNQTGSTLSLNQDGSFTYMPPPGFIGDDTFTYTIVDNGFTGKVVDPLLGMSTITVTVTDPLTTPPWQNPNNRFDVNNDGQVNKTDVDTINMEINDNGARELPSPSATFMPPPFFDVNGDGLISNADARQVTNEINGSAAGNSSGTVMNVIAKIFERPANYPFDNSGQRVQATNEISSIAVGQDFVVKILVEDIGTREGVFSAYVDVNFDNPELATLISTLPGATHPQTGQSTPFVFDTETYGQGAQPSSGDGLIDSDNNGTLDQIDFVGSFAGVLSGPGAGEFVLVEWAMTANSVGPLTITPEPATENPLLDPNDASKSPLFDAGIFGQDASVCPGGSTLDPCSGDVNYVPTIIGVVDPQGMVPFAAPDFFEIEEDTTSATDLPVLQNDLKPEPATASDPENVLTIIDVPSLPATAIGVSSSLGVPAAGESAILEGETLTINDGSRSVTFEFDRDGTVFTGVGIPINVGDSQDDVAAAIVAAIQASVLDTKPSNVGGRVDLGGLSSSVPTLPAGSNLTVGAGVNDADVFTIDSGSTFVSFEFDSGGGLSSSSNVGIPFVNTDNASDVATSIIEAIRNQGFDATPGETGSVNISGNSGLSVDVSRSGLGLTFSTVNDGQLFQQNNTFSYLPLPDFFGVDTFTYTIESSPAAGDGSSTGDITVEVTPINDGPINSVPGTQEIDEDSDLIFSSANPLSVNDIDAGNDNITVNLTVGNGTINVRNSGANVTNNGSGNVSLDGTVTQVNNSLNGLTYSPNLNFNGDEQLTVNTNDNGSTGGNPLSDTDTVNITVRPINDGPIITVPGQQSFLTDFDNTFSSANQNALQISDVDIDNTTDDVQVDLTIGDGALTLSDTSGLNSVTGNGTNSVSIQGSVSNINSSLGGGLTYNTNIDGNKTLSATVNDLGNTGEGGPLSQSDTVDIEVLDFVPVDITGRVFIDHPVGVDPGIGGIDVILSGTDFQGNSVNMTDTTNAVGNFDFLAIRPNQPGNPYTITAEQPSFVHNNRADTDLEKTVDADGQTQIDVQIPLMLNDFKAEFVPTFNLFGRSQNASGITIGIFDGRQTFSMFSGAGWDMSRYSNARLALDPDGLSGLLTVFDNQDGADRTTNVSVRDSTLTYRGNTREDRSYRVIGGSEILGLQRQIANLQDDDEGEVLDFRNLDGVFAAAGSLSSEDTLFDNFVGFYEVVDEDGGIDTDGNGTVDLNPGDAGYLHAVVQNRLADIALATTPGQTDVFADLTFEGGSLYAPFIIVDANPDTVDFNSSDQNRDQIYTPYSAGNADGQDHFRSLGDNAFGIEDLFGLGDADFDDVVLVMNFTSA